MHACILTCCSMFTIHYSLFGARIKHENVLAIWVRECEYSVYLCRLRQLPLIHRYFVAKNFRYCLIGIESICNIHENWSLAHASIEENSTTNRIINLCLVFSGGVFSSLFFRVEFRLIEYRSSKIGICQFAYGEWIFKIFPYISVDLVCVTLFWYGEKWLLKPKVCIRALIKMENHAIHFNSLKIRLSIFGMCIRMKSNFNRSKMSK